MRVAGRDVLLLAVYIPPGDLHAQARQDTYQDLALLIKHVRWNWVMVGDWNRSPEEMAASGFPAFLQGSIITAGEEHTCRQGNGSTITHAIVNNGLAGAASASLDKNRPWGPHYGLRLHLDVPRFDDPVWTWSGAEAFKPEQAGLGGEYGWDAGEFM